MIKAFKVQLVLMQLLPILKFGVTLLMYALAGALAAMGIQIYGRRKAKGYIYDENERPWYDQWQALAFVIAIFVIIGMSQAMIASLEASYSPTAARIPSALTVETPDGEEIEGVER